MARLIVHTEAEDAIAAPKNTLSNWVVVSVTNVDGVPVTGLTAANFKVASIVVGPGGGGVVVASSSVAGLPGCYLVGITPMSGQTWMAGVYIFAVAVDKGSDRGQALARVRMD